MLTYDLIEQIQNTVVVIGSHVSLEQRVPDIDIRLNIVLFDHPFHLFLDALDISYLSIDVDRASESSGFLNYLGVLVRELSPELLD